MARYRDEGWLREKYLDEEMTVREIGDICGVAKTTISDWLDRHDIPSRTGGYRPLDGPEPYRDDDWLHEQYWENERSTADIAAECGCSKETIRRWLDRHGLGTRSQSEAGKLRFEQYPENAEALVEAGAKALKEHGVPSYWNQLDSEGREAFRERLSEARTGEGNPMWNVTGEDNPSWNPDSAPNAFYNLKEWRQARDACKERDGHECQDCGSTGDLHAHHMKPVSAGGARYDLENLVTLCPSCHQKRHA